MYFEIVAAVQRKLSNLAQIVEKPRNLMNVYKEHNSFYPKKKF